MSMYTASTKLRFTEEMKGFVAFGERDYDRGFRQGQHKGTTLSLRLTIKISGVDQFVAGPEHEATAEGVLKCEAVGGEVGIEKGTFNLCVDGADTANKRMLYRLHFSDGRGQPLTLSGFKQIKDDPGFDIWADTTTLYVHIFRGAIRPEDEAAAEVIAAGIIRIHFFDFLQQLTTFRVEGPSISDRTGAMTSFGRLFLGKLWDVYSGKVLASVDS